MAKRCRVHYDERFDRLLVACKSESDVIAGSVRMLNVILDFNTKNKVVNAELLHVSEYLESLGINPNILKKIDSGRLSFRPIRNGYEIAFVLMMGKKIVSVPYNIQLPTSKQVEIKAS